MQKKQIAMGSVLLVLSFIAWRVVSLGMADANARRNPERALSWRAAHPEALLRMAERTAGARRLPEAQAYALRALHANPLDGRALRVLAEAAAARGDGDAALDLYRKAVLLAPRDTATHIWLLEYSLKHRDAKASVTHLDALLRLKPQSMEALRPQANALAVNPATRAPMAEALAKAPLWREDFLKGLAKETQFRTADIAPFYLALSRSSGLSAGEFLPWLERLRAERRYAEAYVTWANLIPGSQRKYLGNVFDGGFEVAIEDQAGPFSWNSGELNGAAVLWNGTRGTIGENSYSVSFEGRRTPFAHLTQLLVLPPGKWRLTWRAKADRLDSQRGLAWRISCEADGSQLAQTEPMQGRFSWRDLSQAFEVPPGCGAQRLTLLIPARIEAETQINGTLWLDEVRVVPDSGLP